MGVRGVDEDLLAFESFAEALGRSARRPLAWKPMRSLVVTALSAAVFESQRLDRSLERFFRTACCVRRTRP